MWLPAVFAVVVVVVGVAAIVLSAWAWSVPMAAIIKAARRSIASADKDLTSAFSDEKEKDKDD